MAFGPEGWKCTARLSAHPKANHCADIAEDRGPKRLRTLAYAPGR